jgi:hypothetical protein
MKLNRNMVARMDVKGQKNEMWKRMRKEIKGMKVSNKGKEENG